MFTKGWKGQSQENVCEIIIWDVSSPAFFWKVTMIYKPVFLDCKIDFPDLQDSAYKWLWLDRTADRHNIVAKEYTNSYCSRMCEI
jgi:hypothetical protein